MTTTLAVGVDLDRPGQYKIVSVEQDRGHTVDGTRILWRDLRASDPDAFVALARCTFEHWCGINGWTP